VTAIRVTYVAGGYPPSTAYGGPAVSSYHLCESLHQLGASVRVIAIAADGDRDLDVVKDRWTRYGSLPVYYGRRVGRTLLAPRLFLGAREAFDADVVHLSGGYSGLLVAFAARARRARLPLVMSPRGSFLGAARARHSARKNVFDRLFGRRIYRQVRLFHATSEEEAASVRARVPGAEVLVAPNGVDVPDRLDFAPPPFASAEPRRYLLYLGRLHPHKQVDRIIDAFARATLGDALELWIAGRGEREHEESIRRAAAAAPTSHRIRFLGAVEGERKASLLRHAEAVVLASRSENFGVTVAEALAHGTPCVVTRTAPWQGLETHRCGFWVDDSAAALAAALERIADPGLDRRAMGQRGREWMRAEHSWNNVARRILHAYEAVRQR
jgi:glycosyltransferase involved in cell wall biosynthesis